ncbi:MAG TPA: hypothetical protein PKE53_14995 [Flavobacteriales bacterium]|nr:hypothetical protein [Flavobacteriales bacterium]HMW96094.1 hypothetical protein [Flavobacteriales bacterium]HNK41426.1 hypothetical protein [Flavobacteriales bacterium]
MITLPCLFKGSKHALLFVGFSALQASSSFGQFWQWSTHFGGGGHDFGYIGAVDQAGNVYSYGQYAGSGPGQAYDMIIGEDTLHGSEAGFVAKHDAEGDYVWSVNCVAPTGTMSVSAMTLDTANDVLIIAGGHSRTSMIGNFQLPDSGAYLAWISVNGVCLNAQNIGSPRTGVSALALHDEDICIAGVTSDGQSLQIGGQSIQPGSFIARFHTDGTPVWAKNMILGFSSQNVRYFPSKILSSGSDLLVFGTAMQQPEAGTFDMDTVHVNVNAGGGCALISMDSETGSAQWIRLLGYGPTGGWSPTIKNVIDVDDHGNAYVTLTVSGDSVHFAPDTVVHVPSGHSLPCLVKYTPAGELSTFRTFGLDAGFSALSKEESGTLLMMASFLDSSSVDVCSSQDGTWLVRLDTSGNCLGSVPVALNTPPWQDDASGLSIYPTPDGIYLSAATPYSPQFSTITFAGESVTSHGWEDVLLAKCALSLGVGTKSMEDTEQLLIYANPNNGSFRIQVPDALVHERQLLLSIHDGSGRMVYQAPLKMTGAEPELDLHNLTPGIYEVTLGNAKRVYHGSMVVE